MSNYSSLNRLSGYVTAIAEYYYTNVKSNFYEIGGQAMSWITMVIMPAIPIWNSLILFTISRLNGSEAVLPLYLKKKASICLWFLV